TNRRPSYEWPARAREVLVRAVELRSPTHRSTASPRAPRALIATSHPAHSAHPPAPGNTPCAEDRAGSSRGAPRYSWGAGTAVPELHSAVKFKHAPILGRRRSYGNTLQF